MSLLQLLLHAAVKNLHEHCPAVHIVDASNCQWKTLSMWPRIEKAGTIESLAITDSFQQKSMLLRWPRCSSIQHQKSCRIHHPGLRPSIVSHQNTAIMHRWSKTYWIMVKTGNLGYSKESFRHWISAKQLFDQPEYVLLAMITDERPHISQFELKSWRQYHTLRRRTFSRQWRNGARRKSKISDSIRSFSSPVWVA